MSALRTGHAARVASRLFSVARCSAFPKPSDAWRCNTSASTRVLLSCTLGLAGGFAHSLRQQHAACEPSSCTDDKAFKCDTGTPHLKLSNGDIPSVVIVVGDPARAKAFADQCDSAVEKAFNREYRSFVCKKHGVDFGIVSHGIGGPGAAICFEELISIGVTTIIRLGTCGSLQEKLVKPGDLVVATAAVREDGLSDYIVPPAFPAVANRELTTALVAACRDSCKTSPRVHEGIAHTTGSFYAHKVANHYGNENAMVTYSKAGALCVEMELAALFIVATLRGIKAAGVCVVDGCPVATEDSHYDPHGSTTTRGKACMLEAGVKVAADCAKRQRL